MDQQLIVHIFLIRFMEGSAKIKTQLPMAESDAMRTAVRPFHNLRLTLELLVRTSAGDPGDAP